MTKSQSQTKKIQIQNFAIFIVAFLVIGIILGPNIGQVYTGTSVTGADTVELTNNGNLDTKLRDFSVESGTELDVCPVAVTNTGGVLSDYPVQVVALYDDGMEADYSDVYFVDSNDNLLSFWLDPDYTSTSALFFVKMSSIPIGDSEIWMKYDDVVIDGSNGDNTFIQYHGAATSPFLDPLIVPYSNVVYEGKVRATDASYSVRVGLKTVLDGPSGDELAVDLYSVTNMRYGYTRNDGTRGTVSESPGVTPGVDVKIKIISDGTNVRFYVDGDEISTGLATNLPNQNMGLQFQGSNGEMGHSFAYECASVPLSVVVGDPVRVVIIDPSISVGDDQLYYDGTLSSILTYSDGNAYIGSSDVSASMKGSLPIIKVGTTQNIKIDHGLRYSIAYVPKNMDVVSPDMFRAGEDMRVDTRLTDTSGNLVSNSPLEMRIRLFDSSDKLYIDEITNSMSFVIPGKYLHDNEHYQFRLSYKGYEFGGWSNEVLADFDVGTEGFIITSSPDKAPEGLAAASFAAASNLVGMAVTGWLDIPIVGDIIRYVADLLGVTL